MTARARGAGTEGQSLLFDLLRKANLFAKRAILSFSELRLLRAQAPLNEVLFLRTLNAEQPIPQETVPSRDLESGSNPHQL